MCMNERKVFDKILRQLLANLCFQEYLKNFEVKMVKTERNNWHFSNAGIIMTPLYGIYVIIFTLRIQGIKYVNNENSNFSREPNFTIIRKIKQK